LITLLTPCAVVPGCSGHIRRRGEVAGHGAAAAAALGRDRVRGAIVWSVCGCPDDAPVHRGGCDAAQIARGCAAVDVGVRLEMPSAAFSMVGFARRELHAGHDELLDGRAPTPPTRPRPLRHIPHVAASQLAVSWTSAAGRS